MESQYNNWRSSKKKNLQISTLLLNILQITLIGICLCTISYLFIVTPNEVQGESMLPEFRDGQIVLTNKLSTWLGENDLGRSLGLDYQRGDTVVFQRPGQSDFIKRIIALPGERVAIRDGFVYVNNNQIEEEYLLPATFTKGGGLVEDGGESKIVPENSYFLLGDNRGQSLDSRFNEVGFVEREWIKGKVILKYWPLNELSVVSRGKIEFVE